MTVDNVLIREAHSVHCVVIVFYVVIIQCTCITKHSDSIAHANHYRTRDSHYMHLVVYHIAGNFGEVF